MCGIAGIIYKNGNGAHRIGRDMTSMLQSMKHRGPDSTGYALYHQPTGEYTVRVNLAESTAPRDMPSKPRRRPPPGSGRSRSVSGAGTPSAGRCSTCSSPR